jgi:hypothetical protein
VLGGPNAFLVDQAEILADTIFCDRGDSGALVLDGNEPTAVGLLWGRNKAGAFAPGRFAYMDEIANVETYLGVSTVFA